MDDDGLFGRVDELYFSHGTFKIHHGGRFVGPPINYKNGKCVECRLEADTINVFKICGLVNQLGYNDISIANIYYKSTKDALEELTSLKDDDSVRDILEIIKMEVFCDIYVDHYMNLPNLIDPILLIGHKPHEEVNDGGVDGEGGVNGSDGVSVISKDGEGNKVI